MQREQRERRESPHTRARSLFIVAARDTEKHTREAITHEKAMHERRRPDDTRDDGDGDDDDDDDDDDDTVRHGPTRRTPGDPRETNES